jgi:hypothetical protein
VVRRACGAGRRRRVGHGQPDSLPARATPRHRRGPPRRCRSAPTASGHNRRLSSCHERPRRAATRDRPDRAPSGPSG